MIITGENKYSVLKQLSILMALDMAGFVIGFAMDCAGISRNMESFSDASPIWKADLYTTWTIWALRFLVWSLTLLTLSRLANLRRAFGKARIWYFVRILTLIASLSATAIFNYWRADPVSESRLRFALLVTLAFIMGMSFLGYAMELAFGNRAILFAGAELLESFGMEAPARKNRRCAKRLSGLVAAQTFLLVSAVGLSAWLVLTKGASLRDPDAILAVLLLLDVAAIALCFLMTLAVMAFGILAAFRMGRTYRAIQELTR